MKTLLAGLALALLALIAPSGGLAADAAPAYVVVNRSENVIMVADIRSVTVNGPVRSAWFTAIFGKPEMIGDAPTAYVAMRWEIDCDKRLYRRQGVITRDTELKELSNSDRTGEWHPVVAETNSESLREFLCEKYSPDGMEGVLPDDLPALRKTLLGQSV